MTDAGQQQYQGPPPVKHLMDQAAKQWQVMMDSGFDMAFGCIRLLPGNIAILQAPNPAVALTATVVSRIHVGCGMQLLLLGRAQHLPSSALVNRLGGELAMTKCRC